jgi:hypothetical protein
LDQCRYGHAGAKVIATTTALKDIAINANFGWEIFLGILGISGESIGPYP